jgi:hypothetical protein
MVSKFGSGMRQSYPIRRQYDGVRLETDEDSTSQDSFERDTNLPAQLFYICDYRLIRDTFNEPHFVPEILNCDQEDGSSIWGWSGVQQLSSLVHTRIK